MIAEELLRDMYLEQKLSMKVIADKLGYSRRGVQYWMNKHGIPVRTVSEAVYQWHNPDGDPFVFRRPKTKKEAELFGMGLGLFWGEGTKSNMHAIRLGNSDPRLIKKFMEFLFTFFEVKRSDLRFGLQLFTDIDIKQALEFWVKELEVEPTQFFRPTITISGSIGTYRKKSKFGVITVHYSNTKARKKLQEIMPF